MILEIIQEFLILPLFHCIGQTINDKIETSNKIKSGLIVLCAVYSIFALIIIIFANSLTKLMAQDPNTINETAYYIRFEMIGLGFNTIVKFLQVIFILLDLKMHI